MVANIVKRLGLTGLAWIAAASCGAAVAADLPPAPSYKAPVRVMAPAPSWTGFYIGGNVGYDWDSRTSGLSAVSTDPVLAPALAAILAAGSYPASLSPSASGVIGGGQIGYNWQLPSQLLIGLEADLQGSGIKGSASQTLTPVGFDVTSTQRDQRDRLVRHGARPGRCRAEPAVAAVCDRRSGLWPGQIQLHHHRCDDRLRCQRNNLRERRDIGRPYRLTVGAGAEAMLAPNWSVKAEYLYVDLAGLRWPRRHSPFPPSSSPPRPSITSRSPASA